MIFHAQKIYASKTEKDVNYYISFDTKIGNREKKIKKEKRDFLNRSQTCSGKLRKLQDITSAVTDMVF